MGFRLDGVTHFFGPMVIWSFGPGPGLLTYQVYWFWDILFIPGPYEYKGHYDQRLDHEISKTSQLGS